MTDRRYVKPARDLIVPTPEGRTLPPHGMRVAWSSYWQRRLAADEIVETDEKSVAAAERKEADAAAKAAASEGEAK